MAPCTFGRSSSGAKRHLTSASGSPSASPAGASPSSSLGACQEVGAEGGEAVWLNLDPGEYTIVEPDIDPAAWEISGAGQVVTVVTNEETTAELRNTNKNVPTALPPGDEPTGHSTQIFLPAMRR